jgi:NADH:ubiquinone oxidoreductase subunit 6 (subunit J)
MLEKYKMEYIVKFSIIILAFAFLIASANWVAIQLKIYELLNVFSIITFVGTFILLLTFTIKIDKSTKKAKEENTNVRKI